MEVLWRASSGVLVLFYSLQDMEGFFFKAGLKMYVTGFGIESLRMVVGQGA